MKPGGRIISSEMIIRRYGASPSQWTSFRALTGDPADNIPGVKGIGPKSASKLLEDNYKLEDLFASNRIDSGRLLKVREEANQITKWERLVTLNRDLNISINLKNKKSVSIPVAAEILQELNLW